jgi:DNA-directed RNA polymerase subunit RPC12/RpoP
MIKPYECTQCGATDFVEISSNKVRCSYCGSLFAVTKKEPTLFISNGANVTFGKTADVEVRGDIEIEKGATVDIQGKVTVLKGGDQQTFRLTLIN